MTLEENKTRIKAFVSSSFRDHDWQGDEDIFAVGFVDSLFAMQLVLFLEKEFEITINDEDLHLENFRTIDAMARLIERKTVSSADA